MKKSIYLIIISVITALCIIVGCIAHVTNWFSFSGSSFGNDAGTRVEKEESVQAFDSIDIDSTVMDLTVSYGTDYAISYDCTKNLVPTIEQRGNTIYLKQNKAKRKHSTKSKCKVELTLPKDTAIKSINITSNVGNVTLDELVIDNLNGHMDVGNLSIKDCKISTDISVITNVGNIEMNNCTLAEGTLESEVGNIELDNCSFTSLSIDTETGDIDLSGCGLLTDYNVSLTTSLGSVNFNNTNHKKSYSQNGSSDKSLTIENEIGNIDVTE